MKQLRLILIPLALAYLTIAGLYVTFQRKIIFHPVGLTGATPVDFHLKNYKDVSFSSFDGVTLTGWWIKHPDNNPRRPVLLYCHGNADCVSQLAEVAKIFYDFGFDALIFDYRCYGGSQKAPLSEKAVDGDAIAAYQWLKAKGIPDERIILWGHSLGSSVAAELATQIHPAGLILEGAFPSIYAVSRQRNPWLLAPPFLIWDKFETGKYVAERTCPLLETHAEKDTVIPINLGQEVFQEATAPKQWLEIKGIDHNDFPSVAYQYEKPIQEFVQSCIRARK
ncbi:MAG TPA: alpha/beta hydrolase [bacterium]|nr:alpha/beta hydrolase [bacterium]